MSPSAKDLEVELTPTVREAIANAIDYQGVLQFTTSGNANLIASPIPPGFPGTDDLPTPAQDVEKPRRCWPRPACRTASR